MKNGQSPALFDWYRKRENFSDSQSRVRRVKSLLEIGIKVTDKIFLSDVLRLKDVNFKQTVVVFTVTMQQYHSAVAVVEKENIVISLRAS